MTAAIPPTTPPTMAPVELLELLESPPPVTLGVIVVLTMETVTCNNTLT